MFLLGETSNGSIGDGGLKSFDVHPDPWGDDLIWLPSLKLTWQLKIGHPKRKQSYSNHPFSGANLLLVSGRVYCKFIVETTPNTRRNNVYIYLPTFWEYVFSDG